ncbi:MAG: hypothetical protein OJF51_002719 [Nitrospira sp.]|nr:MAG: hypothetical protein OJF51_002719 [Nitrospira sp.]
MCVKDPINTATLLRDRGVELCSLTEQIDTTSPAENSLFICSPLLPSLNGI